MREEFENIIDGLLTSSNCEKSNIFGQQVGYNEIYELLDTCKTRRGLIMKINQAIRETQDLQDLANDNEDFQMYAGEIEAYKTFLKTIRKKK